MALYQKIQHRMRELPAAYQTEVLDFVEYLLTKAERDATCQEEREWSSLSLSFALRGMTDEDMPVYTPADLKVVFS